MLNEKYAWHKAIGYCSSRKELSVATGIRVRRITYYLNRDKAIRNKPIGYEHAVAVEKATQGRVSRYELGSYGCMSMDYRPGGREEKVYCLSQLATVTARLAQGVAIERWIGNRQGARNDLLIALGEEQSDLMLRLEKGEKVRGKSAEWAAKMMGFKYSTYVRGKKVLKEGCRELLLALDGGRIVIYSAYTLLSDSHEEQKQRLLDYLNS